MKLLARRLGGSKINEPRDGFEKIRGKALT
jgi:hypothetical protein